MPRTLVSSTNIPDICQVWYTTALYLGLQKVRQKVQIGQSKPKFCVLYAKKYTTVDCDDCEYLSATSTNKQDCLIISCYQVALLLPACFAFSTKCFYFDMFSIKVFLLVLLIFFL